MNEMIKAERNKICSRKQTRMLFLAGVVLIVAYFFFFQFNYQNVFYDYDLEKMALASGFTAIEQRKEVAEIFEGKLSQNTLLTMQEKIDQAKQATVGQDENSAFSAVHVYRDQAAILEYLTNSDGSFKSLETAYPNSPTVTLGYCDGWDKLLSGMGSILSIMICLIVVITLSPVFSEEYALHTDSIIYSARYGRTKLTTSKIIAALEVVIGTYLLYLLLNLVLYGCTYGLQGWNVSIQSSLHYASSIYNLTFLQMDSVSRMGKAVGKIKERIRPTGTIKKMWRFGGQRGRPTPIGRWNLPADRSALTIAATSGRALIRFPLSIWGQPPAKWKSAASAPTRAK